MNPVTGITAVASVLIAVSAYLGQRRRSDFELARALHQGLTTGEVAEARGRLGTLRYGSQAAVARVDRDEIMNAYFVLLWCFERTYYGRQTLLEGRLVPNAAPPAAVVFLDRAIRWHVEEWRDALIYARSWLESAGEKINDVRSRAAFEKLWLELTEANGQQHVP